MTAAGRQIVFINVAHGLCHYSLLILPTAVLTMAVTGGSFGAEYGPILALATVMFVLYGVLSLPQGALAARFGRKPMLAAFFVGTGLSLIGTAFATGPVGLTAALAATGAFAAIYHPIGTAMLVEAAGARPGRSIGVNGVCGNFGVALAPVITAFLVGHGNWQLAFAVPGLACLVAGAAWLLVPAFDYGARRAATPFPEIPRELVRRAVVILLLIAATSGLIFNAFTLLIPKLLQERLDAGALPLLGVAAFAVTVCGAGTQFTVGRLIDRHTLRAVFLPLALVLAPALGAMSLLQGWALLPVAALAAAVIFGQVTVNETMTARYIAPPLRARMYSLRFFVGFLGAAASAPLVGILHDRTGSLAAVMVVLATVAVVMLLCALAFPNRREELRPELWGTEGAAVRPAVGG